MFPKIAGAGKAVDADPVPAICFRFADNRILFYLGIRTTGVSFRFQKTTKIDELNEILTEIM